MRPGLAGLTENGVVPDGKMSAFVQLECLGTETPLTCGAAIIEEV